MAKNEPAADRQQDGEALPSAPAKLTPEGWAAQLYTVSDNGRAHADLWKHGAAAALHQWAAFEHHTGAAMLLARNDYEAVIAAACKPNPQPHAAAFGKV